MIAQLGSTVTVKVYRQARDRGGSDYIQRRANIISAGPPGVMGAWAITVDGQREYLLVRKDKQVGLYSIEGDRGE